MIYIDRMLNRMRLRYYLYHIDGFTIEWEQGVNSKEEIVGIGGFNQRKDFYEYEKKGYGNAMYNRISKLRKNQKNEKIT